MIRRDEIVLGELIGKGQFGEVHIAKCRETEVFLFLFFPFDLSCKHEITLLNVQCAVKIPNLTLGSAKFDMLLNELEIMKKANCPFVAMFMGACHDQVDSQFLSRFFYLCWDWSLKETDKLLIVMELMKGDAEKKCKDPSFPLSERLSWISQACRVLFYLLIFLSFSF